MPPANPWTRVVELVVPGIIGASLALFGVWLNNRTNRTLTEDNRKHELAKALKERHFELTKAFYYEVIKSTHNLQERVMHYRAARAVVREFEANGTDSPGPEAYIKRIFDTAESASESLEVARVALSEAIAVGWILLPSSRFKVFEDLNNMIARVSLDVHNVSRTDEIPPSLLELKLAVGNLVECAKSDLGNI